MEEQIWNQTWFNANRWWLYQKYGTGWYVIADRNVFGVYDTPGKAWLDAKRNFAVDEFIVQFCSESLDGIKNERSY